MENIIIRPARQEDLPVLLEFEQGVIEAERPMDATLKSEKINYYDIAAMIDDDNVIFPCWGSLVHTGIVPTVLMN